MAGREMYKWIFCSISATLFLVACGPSIQQDTTLLSNDENSLTKEFESAVGTAVAATNSAQPSSTRKPSDNARPTSTTSPYRTPTESDEQPGGVLANVTRVLDGDTIDVEIYGQEYRVRYIGIDTPESGSPCADDATQVNVGLVWQETVTLVKDESETDRFDRLLRYVYVGETFVNAELVARGYATSVRFPPDIASAYYFDQLQASASASGLGCWSGGVFGGGGETPPATASLQPPTSNPTLVPTVQVPPTPVPTVDNCHPSYVGACLIVGIGDYDCAGGSGNGPNYVYESVRVVGYDEFQLDGNGDGIGCE